MNIHVARTPPFHTAPKHTYCQSQTNGLTVRPDVARWVYSHLSITVKPFYILNIPANTKHFYNICTASAQRIRRWSSSVQMLYKCFVFAGMLNER